MPVRPSPTHAASSGVKIDRKLQQTLAARSDRPGLVYLAQWFACLLTTGGLVWLARGSLWVWPAMLVYGTMLTVPAYALSHETAHGTAFRTRWLNETLFWLSSLIYGEEPLHRRYTHTNHHTYTWHVGLDSQMPFDTPMDLRGWLLEISGAALAWFELRTFVRLATARYSDMVRMTTPVSELPKLTRNARVFLLVYAGLAAAVLAGQHWLLWYLIVPRLLGTPVMLLFTLIQHVEMQEDAPSILDSTRSFRTDRLGRFLYMNMNHHIEHHLYPQIPFSSLPALNAALATQLPAPDPGFWRTNAEVLLVVARRSLGRLSKAPSIRQAPRMVAKGHLGTIARSSM
ncbi:MAG: fatty acid desaturase [Burkholderiaceae bacterium]